MAFYIVFVSIEKFERERGETNEAAARITIIMRLFLEILWRIFCNGNGNASESERAVAGVQQCHTSYLICFWTASKQTNKRK